MALQYHGNFFQRCVACTFTYTIDGHFYLACPAHHTTKSISRSHTQVVVTVGRKNGFVNTVNMFFQVLYFLKVFLWQTIAGSIWYIDYRSASLDDSLYDTRQIFIISTSRIFAIELHILHELLSILYSRYTALYDFLAVGVKLVFNMGITCANTGMNTFVLSIL